MLPNELSYQVLITGVTDDEWHAFGDSPVEASLQIVKYDDAFAGVGQFMDHVTADIASAASYKDGHRPRARRGQPHRDS